jgi:hypothetical protein
MPIIGYFHICAINNYLSIIRDQIDSLKKSGLFDATDHINVVILSPQGHEIPELNDPKFKIRLKDVDIKLHERPIINIIRQDALDSQKQNQVNYIWYIHSKGVSDKHQNAKNNVTISNWRKNMEAIVIWNWEACLKKLSQENYDTCSIYYTNVITHKYHFSGNFWWAKSSYLVKLPPLQLISPRDFNQYVEPEMWICSRSPRVFSFQQMGPNFTHVKPDLTKLNLKPVPYNLI